MAELEAGDWMSARESFRILQAEYPNDPVAVVSELYIARAGMQEIDWVLTGADPAAVSGESRRVLSQLIADEKVDSRIRFGAKTYLAVLELQAAGESKALETLSDYPSASLSPTVLERDQEIALVLLASSLVQNERRVEGVEAWQNLWVVSDDDELDSLAKSAAFDAVAKISEGSLQEMTTDESSPFVRAVAGWEWVRRRLQDKPDEAERESLEALHQRISADLVAIGESARAAENGAALATWGPVRKLVLGAALPLSGKQQGVGQRALEAMMVAQQAVAGPSDPRVSLVVLDSSLPAEELFDTFHRAGAAAVFGPLDASRTAELAPHARAAGIPLISLSPTALEDVEGAGEWVFRFFVDAVAEARAVARVAYERQGDRRAAIIYPDIGYGRTLASAFRDTFETLGGTVVSEKPYDPSKSDYGRLASSVARANPDAIFLPGRPSKVAELAAFLAQANVWGIDGGVRPSPKSKRVQVHYLGTSLWSDPVVVQQAGNYLAGALIPAWSSPLYDDPATAEFYARFRAAATRDPELLDAVVADAVLMGRALVIERGVSRPEAFRDTIRAPKVYEGVAGTVGFSESGEPIRTLRFLTVEEGAFTPAPHSLTTGQEPASDDPVN